MSKEVVWSFFSFFVLSVSGGVGSERNIMSKKFWQKFHEGESEGDAKYDVKNIWQKFHESEGESESESESVVI